MECRQKAQEGARGAKQGVQRLQAGLGSGAGDSGWLGWRQKVQNNRLGQKVRNVYSWRRQVKEWKHARCGVLAW
jgi:hypothetical protein